MQIKIKTVIFSLSLFFNALIILLLVISGNSKSSSFSYYDPGDYLTAAAVISVPKGDSASVDMLTINFKPRDKAYIQFSVVSGDKKQKKQGNLIFTPLYDPNIIEVSQNGYGMEITALKEGETLMQTLANDGIKDVALIKVSQ